MLDIALVGFLLQFTTWLSAQNGSSEISLNFVVGIVRSISLDRNWASSNFAKFEGTFF